jgi:hypothetical protein
VKNEEMLQRVTGDWNIIQGIRRRKAKLIGHILRTNCRIKHVIKGTIEGRIVVKGRRGGRRKQVLNDLKEKRGCWKWKEEY